MGASNNQLPSRLLVHYIHCHFEPEAHFQSSWFCPHHIYLCLNIVETLNYWFIFYRLIKPLASGKSLFNHVAVNRQPRYFTKLLVICNHFSIAPGQPTATRCISIRRSQCSVLLNNHHRVFFNV